MNKDITYGQILEALYELTPEQLNLPARVTVGRKIYPIIDTCMSCECSGPAVDLVGEHYPLIVSGGPAVKPTNAILLDTKIKSIMLGKTIK